MTHLWVRAEQRPNEERVGLTHDGAAALVQAGLRVTVERSSVRAIEIDGYAAAGCEIAAENTWPDAPTDAIIFGLKELPEDGTALPHRHIMFGHAYKGQPAGRDLLRRFKAGGGTLYDLEYLVNEDGRRVAAFGYWAGYAGAAVALKTWVAQQRGGLIGPVAKYPGKTALLDDLAAEMHDMPRPRAIVIGALGRVGTGASDLCEALGVAVTKWDMAETAHGGPFPEVLAHEIFLNCILARPGCPVFVPASAVTDARALTVIGDIACDPTSDFSPIKVYDRATDWAAPALRVADAPPLDVTAIDNLPSLLPVESSQDYAAQLLPSLMTLTALDAGVWGRAKDEFDRHSATVQGDHDMTIHWCGTGLSSGPGLRRLIEGGHRVVVWNRTVEKAREAVGDIATDIRAFSIEALAEALQPGDIAVSMLPADQHVPIARVCLDKGAHFVSSSYIAPEMRALDAAFRDKGLVSLNEIGLDPGIDHLMAHDLVSLYRASPAYHADNVLSFTSYCGGVPKVANAFRYKFSWAPAGVLKALRSPSRSVRNFLELRVSRPWDAITAYDAPLPSPESFEVYPNRDSLPFLADYRFDPAWRVRDFVRGTIRLNGWADAWAPIFAEIEALEGASPAAVDAALTARANALLKDNSYATGEADRVVLFVSLRAERDGVAVFHQTWAMDGAGDARGTAMGRLVSVPVSLGVQAVAARQIAAGVHAAPHDAGLIAGWMGQVQGLVQYLARVDHLA